MEEYQLLNNGDDCETTLKIKDKDGVIIINDTEVNQLIDFQVTYYTTPQYEFTVGRTNGILTENCKVIGDTVHVYINDFNWGKKDRAKLKVQVSWPDTNFADNKKTQSFIGNSKIKVI